MLENNVEAAEETSSNDDDDDKTDPEAADTLELADALAGSDDELDPLT